KFAELEALETPLEDAFGASGVVIKGIAQDKQAYRKPLERMLLFMSSQMLAYYRATGDDKLKTGIQYSPTKLMQMADDALLGVCARLSGLAAARLAGLVDYGVDATFLADLEAQKELFKGWINAPANAARLRKEAGQQFIALLKQAKEILDDMDLLMTFFILRNPELRDIYKISRKVIRRKAEIPAIKGSIRDADGNALKGVIVRIKGKMGRKSISTAKGNFRFIRLKDGSYPITFRKKGFADAEVEMKTGEGLVEVVMVGVG
ncbi:MAG: carboxypeptidase-like regulatory domain-containing protein, partial [Bacteroidetes bacterium]|nr:carboxypeptidase-like regulatory domain-containing protein [Bacteroidota bacterium]